MNTRHSRSTLISTAATVLASVMSILAATAQTPTPAPDPDAAHPAFQVKISGEGRPMIMIPGLASSGATWDATAAHLGSHFRCFQLTLAGFAGVSPVKGDLLADARDQIAGYIRENHLDHPVIMGHSLGGSIAMDLAARNPQLVGPVIIVDSLPFFAAAWFNAKDLAAAQPTINQMRTGMQSMTAEQWQAMSRSGASTNSMATSPKDQKTLIDWSLASDQKTVTDAMIGVVSEDLRPELKNIDTPVLVIGTWVGLKSYGVTEQSATDEFHQQFAGVKHLQFVMAKEARHFVMWDDPAWFNTQVDNFLKTTTGATVAER